MINGMNIPYDTLKGKRLEPIQNKKGKGLEPIQTRKGKGSCIKKKAIKSNLKDTA